MRLTLGAQSLPIAHRRPFREQDLGRPISTNQDKEEERVVRMKLWTGLGKGWHSRRQRAEGHYDKESRFAFEL